MVDKLTSIKEVVDDARKRLNVPLTGPWFSMLERENGKVKVEAFDKIQVILYAITLEEMIEQAEDAEKNGTLIVLNPPNPAIVSVCKVEGCSWRSNESGGALVCSRCGYTISPKGGI